MHSYYLPNCSPFVQWQLDQWQSRKKKARVEPTPHILQTTPQSNHIGGKDTSWDTRNHSYALVSKPAICTKTRQKAKTNTDSTVERHKLRKYKALNSIPDWGQLPNQANRHSVKSESVLGDKLLMLIGCQAPKILFSIITYDHICAF